tara:strand:+ start:461 stop:700 length:240 start_codon:yes stop_codon:yes gene_type:complete
MKNVHLMIRRKWKIISLEEDLFQDLWDKNLIRYYNSVNAFRPYDDQNREISVNIPKDRPFSAEDFVVVGEDGIGQSVLF